jgi:hypothetical protein
MMLTSSFKKAEVLYYRVEVNRNINNTESVMLESSTCTINASVYVCST